jgi:hypothetical protein
VSTPTPTVPTVPSEPLPKRRRRPFLLWIFLALFLFAIVWVATSSSPLAQGIQELGGNKHDQTILETPFSVSPHNFRYYKFSLPEGSTNISIVGDFTASSETGNRSHDAKAPVQGDDVGIEVFVLSESAFAIWQKGYATSSVYESGRITQGKVHTDLPTGAGVYYLVFSNKFASKAAKNVNATVLLRYKSWLPDWMRRIKSDS